VSVPAKKNWRKYLAWSTNVFLAVIVLILLVPSWRIGFQGWYQSWFMDEAVFSDDLRVDIAEATARWALFDTNNQLHPFTEFSGKPIVLSFWATWCPPCRAELPELQKLSEKFGNEVAVIAVTQETIDVINDSGLPDSYDFLYFSQEFPAVFEVTSFPTLVIINASSELVYRQSGAGILDTPENEKFIRSLIVKN
jgi:thiol-disulfide isomerase/thioredoxin